MPTIPRYSKCAELGCSNPRSAKNRFCIQHGGRDTWDARVNKTPERRAFNAMYDTKQWKVFRVAHLSTQPLCQSCLCTGIVTPAQHVDHLFPWSHIGRHAFTRNVFQSLCHSCHTLKTVLESKGICRLYGEHTKDYDLTDYEKVCITRLG